jgi:DNA-binding response OmpR family regulator
MEPSVLVVEDNPVLARPLTRFLQQSGYTVHFASCCADARRLLGPFDVGVFDVDLSDGSGIDLCAELLTSKVVRSAVFYTGALDNVRFQTASALGVVVRKTQSAEDLRRAICAALGQASAEGADGCCTERKCS